MGRGGGSSSGGSSSHGGGSSRTHYSSGSSHRGGGSSSSGFSRGGGHSGGGFRSSRSNYHPPYGSHYHVHHTYDYGPRYAARPVGCGSTIVVTFILIVFLVMAFSSFRSNSDVDQPITASTVERTKLPVSECTAIDEWFEDNMPERWIHNDKDLISGMKAFYDKTGVQPYLVLFHDIKGNIYPTQTEIENELRRIYDEKMPDGGHIVVGFVEGVSSEYASGAYAGAQAELVMDEEAREILLDYVDYYYTRDDLSDEEFFSSVFESTADKIMRMDEIASVSRGKTIRRVVLVVCVLGVVITLGVVIVRRRKYKAAQAEADAKILNSDLNSPSDPLHEKYDVK